ncbi:uncharacterized protein LY79DRAFT_506243 [Colletotrichum navitas]|uniref:DUF676 domain-containing protein n=1 Tax=Colletotrichum navitas TaxID=681940 RepID=A0AAD8VBG2_9PEZI|nr:uncharacterized protein LY79DRAFT_506243 [Colletotrichum navitas]KAK1598445.1 hypothetical protein LY79DRAFT_506243 [Colletotrichum navitas]
MSEFKNWTQETEMAVLSEVAAAQSDSPERVEPRHSLPAQPSEETQVDSPGSPRPSSPTSHWNPLPGFVHIDGDVNGRGYNETLVDIVCVPCPGADPVETWARDPLPEGYFGRPGDVSTTAVKELAGASILSPTINRHLPMATHLWVRQGIRKEVSEARVLLYRHRELVEGMTLDDLALDLIEQVWNVRYGIQRSRPLFFIAHSVGGLVVKLALLYASRTEQYKPFMYNCHGVSFFATPHRGSSYLSMKNLEDSIRRLLRLQRPLPRSISDYLRLGHKPLLKMHEEFSTIASELRIWTFYETIDSQLSGSGSTSRGRAKEVRFGAPIASIKSSMVGVRQEHVFSLDSEHSNCASFGVGNTETMNTYLQELTFAVQRAMELSSQYIHTPLNLKKRVKVEIIGFYEDPDAEMESAIRLYFTKLHLQKFLEQGPERCLEQRLQRTALRPHSDPDSSHLTQDPHKSNKGIGILSSFQELGQKVWQGRSDSPSRPKTPDSESQGSPGITVTRPSVVEASHSMPVETIRRMQSLKVPPLSPPGFNRPSSRSSNAGSTRSDPTDLELSPKAVDPEPLPALGVGKRHSEPFSRRQDRLSRGSALDDLTAGFSRPDPASRKFMWIHTPFTNPSWVKDVLVVLANPHDPSFIKLSNNDNWASKHVIGRHSQSQAPFVKPSCNYIPPGSTPSPHASPNLSVRTISGSGPSSGYLYMYLPFLHFDTYIDILHRRNFIKRRMQHGRARPVPPDVADLDSPELRMIWEYIGYDPPLNYRRTLDQFAYPSLRDTWARDDDQMLYKLTKDRTPNVMDRDQSMLQRRQTSGSTGSPVQKLSPSNTGLLEEDTSSTDDEETDLDETIKDGKVLMVDQLWLWAIDTTTLSTFFNRRESKRKEGPLFQQSDLRNSVYNELNGDLTGRCENALDLAAFITERMTSSLKHFRMQTFKDVSGSDSDSDSNRPESIKKRHKRELEEAERENRENTSALMELRDMEDELKSLVKLFETQEVVVRNMKSIFEGEDIKHLTRHGLAYLEEALSKVDGYKSQTVEMLKRVDTTRTDYEKLLEMVQRKAQVDEVRWSRLQTELASSQNLSVMIFTTFTVIFLPLSFFSSLFGMNTVEWDRQLPTIGFIGAVSLPASAFIIATALVAAFSSRVQGFVRTGYKGGEKALQALGSAVVKFMPRRKQEKRRVNKAEREERRTRKMDRGYDFWQNVRRERASGYRIPEVNRHRART